jgi:hypothetical protein
MPTYSFKNKKTKRSYELFLTLSEREQYLKDHPNVVQEIVGTAIVSGAGDIRSKIPNDFKDLMNNIKKHHRHSTIQTA